MERGEWNSVKNRMRNLWIFVLRRSIETEFSVGFCSVERGEWSAENGILAKCLCKFKVYFKFFGFFCFMEHEKRIVKTEFAWIFLLRLRLATRWVANAQNDKIF